MSPKAGYRTIFVKAKLAPDMPEVFNDRGRSAKSKTEATADFLCVFGRISYYVNGCGANATLSGP